MKRALNWLLGIIAGVVGLVFLIVAAVVTVVAYPQLLVNDRTLAIGARFADRAGVHLTWEQAHVQIESQAFLSKRLTVALKGLCVRIPAQGLDACFAKARIAAAGGLQGLKLRLTEVGPVDLRGGRVVYVSPVAPDGAKPLVESKNDARSGELLPSFLAGARLMPLHVDVPALNFKSGTTQIEGGVEVASRLDAQGESRIEIDAHAALSPGGQRAQAKLELENPKGFLGLEGWRLTGDLQAKLPDGLRASAQLKLDPRTGAGALAYAYSIDALYAKSELRAELKAVGEISPDRLFAQMDGTALGLAPQLKQIWVKGCEATLARESSETRPGSLRLSCPIQAIVPVPPSGGPPIELPIRAGIRVVADLKSSAFPPTVDSAVDGKVGVELTPVLTPILEGRGRVESQIAGVPKDFPKGWRLDTDLGFQFKIKSFEKWVKQLSNTAYDVWAPLRVLKGTVEANLQGKFDANSGSAPVQLKTRLVSPTQILNLDARGTLQILQLRPAPQVHLTADLALSEVRLELPPLPELPSLGSLNFDPMPRFLPDVRMSSAPIAPKQLAGMHEPAFTYDIRIHTPDEQHPVKLLTSQVKTPVPLAVNLLLTDRAALTGHLKVLSFPVELFRRNVQLDHLSLNIAPIAKDSVLNGSIVVPYADYTITVLLLGTTEKPQVKFLSDPPLPDDQIIAVLVFGQSLDALDPDQQQSVGSSRAALRSGAMSLASLFLFSSTDIESVDYDPTSGVASLRYKLAKGTSLNLSQGVGGGQPSVGIRKRLSKHLAITTTLNNPSEQQTKRTVSTFLEWAYQY